MNIAQERAKSKDLRQADEGIGGVGGCVCVGGGEVIGHTLQPLSWRILKRWSALTLFPRIPGDATATSALGSISGAATHALELKRLFV